jgi:hypothetical protein
LKNEVKRKNDGFAEIARAEEKTLFMRLFVFLNGINLMYK